MTAARHPWFAHHEFRLSWRDWLVDDDRRPADARAVAVVFVAFVVFMHLVAYSIVGRFRRHRGGRQPTLVAIPARAAVLAADDVAGDGVGDPRVLCALRSRPHPVVAGRGAPLVRGTHRHDGAWQKNRGVRIDHLMLSPQAADRLAASGIDKHVRGWEKPSDHVPVWIDLEFA